MFNFFRKAFSWGVKDKKKYPHMFRVTVYIDHPQVIGHIVGVDIDIDANDRHHAQQRLNKELTFFISRARPH